MDVTERNRDDLTRAAEGRWWDHWTAGPTQTRWTSLPVQVGDPAPDATLVDRDGTALQLSSLWADRPLLLMFWRHFGCSCGLDRAARVAAEHESYVEAGGRVAIIGQGEPERASAYHDRVKLPAELPLLSDPERSVASRYGLLEGLPAQILFDAPDEYLRCEPEAGRSLAEARRELGRPMVDNPWLLPAEFVIGTDGRIALAYRYQYCEGYPDPRVLVAAIRAAAGSL